MSTFTLSIQYSDTRSETLQFSGSRFLIGREYGDIVLRDPKVSGRHGELRVSHDGQYLTYSDLNSSNGSYRADGQRIVGTIPLSVGSVIYIGSSSITVLAIGSPRPAAPPPTPAPPRRGSTVVATAASVKSIVAAEVQGVLSGEIGSSSGAAEEEPSDHTPPHGIEVTPVASEPRRGVPRGGTLPPPLTPAPTPAQPQPSFSIQPVGAPIPLSEPTPAAPEPAPAAAPERAAWPATTTDVGFRPPASPSPEMAPSPVSPSPAMVPSPVSPSPAMAPSPVSPSPAPSMSPYASPSPSPYASPYASPSPSPSPSPTPSPTPTPSPSTATSSSAATMTRSGTWYKVQAGETGCETFVMALSGGRVIVRTQTSTPAGLVETMVVAPATLDDFTLA